MVLLLFALVRAGFKPLSWRDDPGPSLRIDGSPFFLGGITTHAAAQNRRGLAWHRNRALGAPSFSPYRFRVHAPIRPFTLSDWLPLNALIFSSSRVDLSDKSTMELLALDLNLPEMRLGEVLIPWVAVVGTLGFLAGWLVIAIMERTGLSRYVWHLPLFFLALVVLLSSLIGMVFQP
jgi:hypothetical protein